MGHRYLTNTRARWIAGGAAAVVGTALLAGAPQSTAASGAASCRPADDAVVISDWNATAVSTLVSTR